MHVLSAFSAVLQVEQYKEKLARALADMENMRERTMRQADKEKQFAIAVSPWPEKSSQPCN